MTRLSWRSERVPSTIGCVAPLSWDALYRRIVTLGSCSVTDRTLRVRRIDGLTSPFDGTPRSARPRPRRLLRSRAAAPMSNLDGSPYRSHALVARDCGQHLCLEGGIDPTTGRTATALARGARPRRADGQRPVARETDRLTEPTTISGLSLRLAAGLALPYGWDVGVPAVLGGVQVPFA